MKEEKLFKLVKSDDKGVTIIGKDKDSFKKFYEVFKEEVFKPVALSLPSKQELEERMKKALERGKKDG